MSAAKPEPDEYLAQRVREALAEDHRVGELYVRVSVAGDKVFVTGTLPTEDRRRAVTEVVREVCPEMEVHNQMSVNPLSEPPEVETIE